VLIEIGNQNIGALACIGDCDYPPDAAVTACDDRLLSSQLATAAVALLAGGLFLLPYNQFVLDPAYERQKRKPGSTSCSVAYCAPHTPEQN
jgi:hypothetical protein